MQNKTVASFFRTRCYKSKTRYRSRRAFINYNWRTIKPVVTD